MRIVSVKVNPIKINGEPSQWGNSVCDKTYELGRLRIQVDAKADLLPGFCFGYSESLVIEFLIPCSSAVLFITSSSSRVCKSLHIWKHSQPGLSAGDHRRIRWV